MEVLTGIATAKVVGACAAGTIVDGLAHLERHKGSSERQVGQEKQLEQEHGVLSSQPPQQLSERLLRLLVSGMVGAEETGVTLKGATGPANVRVSTLRCVAHVCTCLHARVRTCIRVRKDSLHMLAGARTL